MHTTAQLDVLTRSEIWSAELKQALQDELMAQRFVKLLNGFPDGTTFTIPSIGDLPVRNYAEDTPVVYDSMDTGEFQFSITEYVSTATYITAKARQDVYYASQLEASFLPKQLRAIMEKYETDVLALAAGGASGGQTVSNQNQINGVDHRFVATGSSAIIKVEDFAKARYSLKKANVPDRNLIRGDLDRRGQKLYVIHRSSPYLAVVDLASLAVERRIYVVTGAVAVGVDPRSDRIYLAKRNAASVEVFDPASFLPIDFIPLEGECALLAFDLEQNNLGIVERTARRVRIVRLVGGRVVAEVDVADDPFGLAFVGER